MTDTQKLILVLFAIGVVLALVKLFRVFNSPDGERYLRMRMQGPFVPLDPQDQENGGSKKASTATKP